MTRPAPFGDVLEVVADAFEVGEHVQEEDARRHFAPAFLEPSQVRVAGRSHERVNLALHGEHFFHVFLILVHERAVGRLELAVQDFLEPPYVPLSLLGKFEIAFPAQVRQFNQVLGMVPDPFRVVDRVDQRRDQLGFLRRQRFPGQFDQVGRDLVLKPVDQLFAAGNPIFEFARSVFKKQACFADGLLRAPHHVGHFLDRLLQGQGRRLQQVRLEIG